MNVISIAPKVAELPYRQLVKQHGSPLLVLDCDTLRQQYRTLQAALPKVRLYYAIKSLPEKVVVENLALEGAGFDVATSGELEMLRSAGINPRSTIHTHPIKRDKDIRDALRFGCTTFVVDNINELLKFRPYRSRVGLLLRVSFRNKDAACDLSKKFGCSESDVPFLLTEAIKHGIRIKGLSFHVGSQSLDSQSHVDAIMRCRQFYANTALPGSEKMHILDIGGGFPADYQQRGIDLDAFFTPINEALDSYPEHIRFIAEPGRFISAPAITSISTIMGNAQREQLHWYYLDDGVYGAYSGQIYDHAHYPLTLFSDAGTTQASVLAGPTCDSIDVIAENVALPPLVAGDIVVGKQMGAYTLATAGEFNSIPKPKLVVLNSNADQRENVHYLYVD